MQQQSQEFDKEINLRECIDVIIKRKALILAVFFVSIIAVAVISYATPKSYETSILIEPPVIGINDSGGPIFADSPLSIKARIDAGAFDSNIIKTLELNPQKTKFNLIVSQPKDSTFLKIGLKEPESSKELGIKILNQVLKEINNFYKTAVEFKKNDIDRRVSVISNRVKNADNLIKLNEESLKIIEGREKGLIGEVKDTRTNTEQLLIKRSVLLEKKIPGDDISSLLYTNIIQQNISYYNQLNNQLAEIKTKKENMSNAIKTLQNEINDSSIEIEKLKSAKESIRNINLITAPQVLSKPIGPGRRKAVILAGILSLMFGTLLAFFIEFLEKSKKA